MSSSASAADSVSFDDLAAWVGRQETRTDLISPGPMAALAATLDRPELDTPDGEPPPGTALPPLWHWTYFTPRTPASDLGADGHARLGGFLPPVPLPRRMWAGGRLTFHGTLCIGDTASRTSTIHKVKPKEGRTGRLVFVEVHHEITGQSGGRVHEEHDIVYREPPDAAAPAPVPPAAPDAGADGTQSRTITPDPVLLFRYSALTFNGHRIHYDRPYAEGEGYGGLVVHGPLIATLLLDLVRDSHPDRPIAAYAFRAVSPLVDTEPFTIHCRKEDGTGVIHAWAATLRGGLAMEATATPA